MGCITSKHGDGGGDRTVEASYVPVVRKNCHGFSFSSSSKQHSWRVDVDRDDEKSEENGRTVTQKKSRELMNLKREGSGRKSGTFSFKLGVSQRFVEAEHVAAGWPSWLSSAAGEAVHGWVPLQADSFEKLDKVENVEFESQTVGFHLLKDWLYKPIEPRFESEICMFKNEYQTALFDSFVE